MALESPAYVISASSHSAALFRQAMQSVFSGSGMAGWADLYVSQNGTPNMSVNVAAGFVWCPGTLGSTAGVQANGNAQSGYGLPTGLTSQGCYGAYNDATVNLPIAAADPANPRIDLICASVQDAQYAGSNNQPLLQVVTGTAAPSPSVPSAPASTVVLAQVAVAAGVTSIVTANITDVRPILGVGGRDRGYSAAADFNAMTVPGMYRTAGTTNAPGSGLWHVAVESAQGGVVVRQVAYGESTAGAVYSRYYLSGAGWSTWIRTSPQGGTFTAVFSSSPSTTATVTFAEAFAAVPVVTLDIQPYTNNTPMSWGITSITTTGFTYFVRMVGGTSVTANLAGRYIAVMAT